METKAKRPLVIVGNGEIASMAFEYFLHDSAYEPAAFTISREYINSPEFEGLPLLSIDDAVAKYPPGIVDVFVAIGDSQLNHVRARHFALFEGKGYTFASYVSSRAFVWHNVAIGRNCFILEHNVLQAHVRIGDNTFLWSGNHIGHRTVVHRHVFITSHVVISGFCEIGEYSFLGVNSAVANGVHVASENFISMGAAVAASTTPDSVYQGAPAEPRKVSARRFCRVKGD